MKQPGLMKNLDHLRLLRPEYQAIPSEGLMWGERWDSNPRQPGSQPGALPTELRPPYQGFG